MVAGLSIPTIVRNLPPFPDRLIGAVNQRLREEFAKLQVEINDEKSRRVDLERGENFGFLGFDFRYLRSLRGVMRPHYTPKLKKRTALLRELKEVFRRHRSQPIERAISLINPMLRGWVNYFAVGNSSGCFTYIRDWVEKKVTWHGRDASADWRASPRPYRESRSSFRRCDQVRGARRKGSRDRNGSKAWRLAA